MNEKIFKIQKRCLLTAFFVLKKKKYEELSTAMEMTKKEKSSGGIKIVPPLLLSYGKFYNRKRIAVFLQSIIIENKIIIQFYAD